jgi:putative membrane protein
MRGEQERSDEGREAIPFRLPWGRAVVAHKPYPNEMRDHLANVRTFLAWVRTAIAMMGFGFVIAKFGLLLRELPGHHVTAGEVHLATIIGSALVIVGGLFLILSALDFLSVRQQIERQVIAFSVAFHLLLAGILVAVSLTLAIYIWVTGFP